MLMLALVFGVAHAQPLPSSTLRATSEDCAFAIKRCIATDQAIERRARDKQLDAYCDNWKDACLRAKLPWDRRQ